MSNKQKISTCGFVTQSAKSLLAQMSTFDTWYLVGAIDRQI